jgi:hypothetical protein
MPGTVTVYCKIPNGIILRGFVMKEQQELMQGGATRTIIRAVNKGKSYRIAGPKRLDRGNHMFPIASGFAVTQNVDAEIWENWLSANMDSDYVKNGLIFAQAKPSDGVAEAREKETQRSGLEPIDPHSDPRTPKKRSQTRAGALNALEMAQRP